MIKNRHSGCNGVCHVASVIELGHANGMKLVKLALKIKKEASLKEDVFLHNLLSDLFAHRNPRGCYSRLVLARQDITLRGSDPSF